MESEWIFCVQCEEEFEFSVADQIRYEDKGFEAPQRCPVCRRHKTKVIYLDRKREANYRKVMYRDKRELEN